MTEHASDASTSAQQQQPPPPSRQEQIPSRQEQSGSADATAPTGAAPAAPSPLQESTSASATGYPGPPLTHHPAATASSSSSAAGSTALHARHPFHGVLEGPASKHTDAGDASQRRLPTLPSLSQLAETGRLPPLLGGTPTAIPAVSIAPLTPIEPSPSIATSRPESERHAGHAALHPSSSSASTTTSTKAPVAAANPSKKEPENASTSRQDPTGATARPLSSQGGLIGLDNRPAVEPSMHRWYSDIGIPLHSARSASSIHTSFASQGPQAKKNEMATFGTGPGVGAAEEGPHQQHPASASIQSGLRYYHDSMPHLDAYRSTSSSTAPVSAGLHPSSYSHSHYPAPSSSVSSSAAAAAAAASASMYGWPPHPSSLHAPPLSAPMPMQMEMQQLPAMPIPSSSAFGGGYPPRFAYPAQHHQQPSPYPTSIAGLPMETYPTAGPPSSTSSIAAPAAATAAAHAASSTLAGVPPSATYHVPPKNWLSALPPHLYPSGGSSSSGSTGGSSAPPTSAPVASSLSGGAGSAMGATHFGGGWAPTSAYTMARPPAHAGMIASSQMTGGSGGLLSAPPGGSALLHRSSGGGGGNNANNPTTFSYGSHLSMRPTSSNGSTASLGEQDWRSGHGLTATPPSLHDSGFIQTRKGSTSSIGQPRTSATGNSTAPVSQTSSLSRNRHDDSLGGLDHRLTSALGSLREEHMSSGPHRQPQEQPQVQQQQHGLSASTGSTSMRAIRATKTTHVPPILAEWLKRHYATDGDGRVARHHLYAHYLSFCESEDIMHPGNPSSFGKMLRRVFPHVKTRRLGTRGNSRYHYLEIRAQTAEAISFMRDDNAYRAEAEQAYPALAGPAPHPRRSSSPPRPQQQASADHPPTQSLRHEQPAEQKGEAEQSSLHPGGESGRSHEHRVRAQSKERRVSTDSAYDEHPRPRHLSRDRQDQMDETADDDAAAVADDRQDVPRTSSPHVASRMPSPVSNRTPES